MKQLMAMTLLGMILGQQALADYQCYGYQGEKLQIQMEKVPVEVFKGAILTAGEVSTAFQANGSLPDGSYSLQDGEGNPAALKISHTQVYGGGCKRCGDDYPTQRTFAKLTYQQSELYFTCE